MAGCQAKVPVTPQTRVLSARRHSSQGGSVTPGPIVTVILLHDIALLCGLYCKVASFFCYSFFNCSNHSNILDQKQELGSVLEKEEEKNIIDIHEFVYSIPCSHCRS